MRERPVADVVPSWQLLSHLFGQLPSPEEVIEAQSQTLHLAWSVAVQSARIVDMKIGQTGIQISANREDSDHLKALHARKDAARADRRIGQHHGQSVSDRDSE